MKKNEILSAMEKMEREAKRIEEEKKLAVRKEKRPIIIIEEPDREDVIKEQNIQHHKDLIRDLKFKAIMIGLVVVITLVGTYSMTKEGKVTLIENIIFLFCGCGIVLAAAKR